MKNLVIVESPTKAKTISKFLGKDYTVKSSYGHVRDLPKSKMGIDFENDFEPSYVVPLKAKPHVTELKKLAAKAGEIYFATDSDREGEAISWHLKELFGMKDKDVKRITFHEITKKAILDALTHPIKLNINLVDAQQARRILDRLVGYELSPLLWKKVAMGLSAGRVQSVAVRLVVEREREIEAFKKVEYWTVEGMASKDEKEFAVSLSQTNGTKLGKFDLTADDATKAAKEITDKELTVTSVSSRQVSKNPLPPFTTSGLQIDANRRFGYSAKQTMMLAQQLYEGIELGERGSTGLITYMRTDSVNLAEDFISAAQEFAGTSLGKEYATGGRRFKSKSKNAQEAHEAIRPTDISVTPDEAKTYLDPKQAKIYQLIWQRALASQLPASITEATSVDLKPKGTTYTLRANGSVMVFDGWQKVYRAMADGDTELPAMKEGDTAELKSIEALQHFTQPPARYSEAGLVKALESRGIGRPSTFAPTIATIIERSYVEKLLEDKRLKPTQIGIVVNDLLVEHFPDIVDYDFTAALEKDLDLIANGEKEWRPIIKRFYGPFKKQIEAKAELLDKKKITEEATDQICEKCGKPMVIKLGRFGRFLACTGYPDCKNTKQINNNNEIEAPETTDEKCEVCGKPMVVKRGRFGTFLGCSGYPECKNIKSKSKGTGVTCPECGKGEIVEKRSKKGRTFYSCNKYPDCKFALWSKPTGEKCPTCSSLLVYAAKGMIACSNKECEFKKQAPDTE